MDYKYDAFISYSRKDSEIVLPIVERLQKEGFNVWIDMDGVESGDAFKSVIVEAIKESKTFLFFSSKNSLESPWTVKEVNVAVLVKKEFIPIKLDETEYNNSIMFDMAGLDYIDYKNVEKREACITKLVKSLSFKTSKQVQKKSESNFSKQLNSHYFEFGYDIAKYVIHKLRGQTNEFDNNRISEQMQCFQLDPNILLSLTEPQDMMFKLNECAFNLGQFYVKNAENSVCLGALFVLSIIAKRSNVSDKVAHTYDDAIVLSCRRLGVANSFIARLINATDDEMESMCNVIKTILDNLSLTTHPCYVCGNPLAKDYEECPMCYSKC